MSGCLIALALLFYFIGFIVWVSQRNQGKPASGGGGPLHSLLQGLGQGAPATQQNGGTLQSSSPSEASMNQTVTKLNAIRTGSRIKVRHPVQGELTAYVLGKVTFTELWQRGQGAQVPWVPTGNTFTGLWLEGNLLALEWQNRLYLLDERIALSDGEIQRDFAPHARKFAQSNQTAEVLFAYPPAMWRMVDIGKFSISKVEGEGVNARQGAVGRFIHASGEGKRALVLEDYEGGGQDTVWIGYILDENDIEG